MAVMRWTEEGADTTKKRLALKKRFREEGDDMSKGDTTPKCLMLFPTREAEYETNVAVRSCNETHAVNTSERLYKCKTCGRKFQSFQALGGHRASHKKSGLIGEGKILKMHKCSICGEEFVIGQALGGHMRRHRDVIAEEDSKLAPPYNFFQFPSISEESPQVKCFDLNLPPPALDLDKGLGQQI